MRQSLFCFTSKIFKLFIFFKIFQYNPQFFNYQFSKFLQKFPTNFQFSINNYPSATSKTIIRINPKINPKVVSFLFSIDASGNSSAPTTAIIAPAEKAKKVMVIGGGVAGSISADSSYINRLRTHNAETDPDLDLVVVQLSTNDSKGQCETGTVRNSIYPATFDEVTTTGALEAITAYAKETWGARVLVITGTYFEDEMTYSGGQNAVIYQTMIERCHELDEKWGDDFTVLDLWHNDAMYENVKTGDSLWRSYMCDAIHPTKKG